MSKFKSSTRIFVVLFALVGVPFLSYAAQAGWPGVFGSVGAFFARTFTSFHAAAAVGKNVETPPNSDSTTAANGRIVFKRAPFDNGSIIASDISGANEQNLGSGVEPTWSFDGTKIAFVKGTVGNNGLLDGRVWIMNADGSNGQGVIDSATNLPLIGTEPKISPDGKKIAFNDFRSDPSFFSRIYVMDVSFGPTITASNRKQLTGDNDIAFAPTWQPLLDTATGTYTKNGKVAFARYNNGTQDLFVANADAAGSPVNITNTPGRSNNDPSFSFDGTKLLFSSDRDTAHPTCVWMANVDSNGVPSNVHKLTTGFFDNSARFSPDGNLIVYVSSVESNGDAIFAANITPAFLNPDGTITSPVRIFPTNHEDDYPSWGPAAGGGTPTPTPTPIQIAAGLSFDGRLRDRVSRNDAGTLPDGDNDGTFTLALAPPAFSKSYKSIVLTGPNGNEWDTIPQQPPPLPASAVKWIVGISDSLDGQLFNCPDGSLTCSPFQVGSPGVSRLFVPDSLPSSFVSGSTFTVTVTFGDNSVATATTTIGNIPTADLGLYMRAENQTGGPLVSPIAAGQQYRYHPQVTNYGPSASSGTIISINLPQGVAFKGNDISNPGVCTQASSGSPVRCSISSTIAVGSTFGLIFNVQANQAGTFDAAANVVSNLSEPVPDPHPNSFTVTTTTNSAADLSVRVTGDGDPVQVDAPLIYTVTVKNNGPLAAPNTQVRLTVDDNVYYVQYQGTSPSCVRQGTSRQLLCSVGSLSSGAEAVLKIQVRPKVLPNNADHSISLIAVAISDLFDFDSVNSNINFKTSVVAAGRPLNDNFLPEAARPGSGPVSLNGLSGQLSGASVTNVGSTREAPINYGLNLTEAVEPNHAGQNGGKSVWYYWTPPAGGKGGMTIDTSGSLFDTLLSVYAIDTTTLLIDRELVSNDNAPGGGVTSSVNFNFDAKHVYYVVVDGKQGATGKITLNWNAILAKDAPAPVPQRISVGIFPDEICTSSSNDETICPRDTSGNTLIKIKGENFTNDSLGLLAGYDLFALYGGQITHLGPTEIDQQIPPGFKLDEIGLASVRVVTPRVPTFANSAVASTSNSVSAGFVPGLPDGSYNVAFQSRGLNLFTVKNATIPPGGNQQVCINDVGQNGGEYGVCITFHNGDPNNSATITPTFFSRVKGCLGLSGDRLDECMAFTRTNDRSFAFNTGSIQIADVDLSVRLDMTADQIAFIQSTGGKIKPVFEGGSLKVGTVDPNKKIVTTGGGKIIGENSSGLVAPNSGKLIGQDGNGLISNDGGSVISRDGAGLISNDGGSLISNDGGSFSVLNGVVSNDGGTIAEPDSGSNGLSRLSDIPDSVATGAGGMFLVKSSGGQEPQITITTDPVTGEVHGTLTMKLDNTSFPKVSDIGGMAFTMAVNPAVITVAAPSVSFNASSGNAAVKIKREGDLIAPITVDYGTLNGTATAGIDYTATVGSVKFAPNETEKTINIPLLNASSIGSRTFNLVIGDVYGGAIDAPNFTAVTIQEATPTPTPTPGNGGANLDGNINRSDPAIANSGDNSVDLKDLQWYDNFVNGTYIPAAGGASQPLTVGPTALENQRRDIAPLGSGGDGCLNAADRQQMVLIALSLASPGATGGPSVLNLCPPVRPSEPAGERQASQRPAAPDPSIGRAIRTVSLPGRRGGDVAVSVDMDAVGDETMATFTIDYDPLTLSIDNTSFPAVNRDVLAGSDMPEGTSIAVNSSVPGKVTVIVSFDGPMPAGRSKRLIDLIFHPTSGNSAGNASARISQSAGSVQIINGEGQDLPVNNSARSPMVSELTTAILNTIAGALPFM